MKKLQKRLYSLLIRYTVLILVAIPNLFLFYFIFTPLTIYPLYFLFGLFFNPILMKNIILINNFPIELIPACIAGAAYYLLLILNLSVPNIKLQKRIKMISISFVGLLFLNILRIFLLSLIFLSGNSMFDLAHQVFWYLGSTVFVVGIWFAEVKIFKIKEIPFYSDIKFLFKNIKSRK